MCASEYYAAILVVPSKNGRQIPIGCMEETSYYFLLNYLHSLTRKVLTLYTAYNTPKKKKFFLFKRAWFVQSSPKPGVALCAYLKLRDIFILPYVGATASLLPIGFPCFLPGKVGTVTGKNRIVDTTLMHNLLGG